jgi:glycosyltransferase involved in cell wall biosynthesis
MVHVVYANEGISVYDELFLSHLSKKFDVTFLSFNPHPRYVPRDVRAVIMPEPMRLLPAHHSIRIYSMSALRGLMLRKFANALRPDVLVGCWALEYGFYSAVSGFRPFVLIIWGSDIVVAPKHFFIFRLMVQFALKRADAVILDSEVQRDAAIKLGCDPRKILKFPWFDPKSIQLKCTRDEVRSKLGWNDNPIVICLRKHDPIYGVEYAIEAIPHILNALPETRFVIIGDGPLTGKLKRMVNELGIQEYVKFLGHVSHEEATTYLNAADVHVSMSLSDGTSASLLEAMSLGVPSIVTSIPGNMEWIKDGWNGCLIPVRDSRQLADKVILLLKDEKLRKRVREKAFETVSDQINWSANLKALYDLISKLAKEKRARDS